MKRERHTYLTLQTVEAARQGWLDRISAEGRELATERVPLSAALHRVLAEPVAARRSSPAFHGADMDGIAVNAESTFTASTRRPLRLTIGTDAFWINTGHPLPAGTNAVVMVENVNTEPDGQHVVIEKAAFPWQHVRKLGEDMVASEIILPPGVCIGPYELGALAAGGVLEPLVFKKPRVGIIPSGTEIVPLTEAREEDLCAGRCLPEFNSYIFSAIVQEAGGEAFTLPIVPDDPEAISAAIDAAVDQGADLVLLNAGSSAGSHDYSADVIAHKGELLTHGVAVMPGKPTALGMVRGVPIIGSPGYPVSAIVALEEFVQPLLALLQKRCLAHRETVTALPVNPLPSRPGMEERIRVKLGRVDDTFFAVPLPRGAGTVTSLSRADGIISVARDCEGISSHDNTLDLIDSFLRREHPRFRLASAHVGSLGGLMALKRHQCHLAGSHLLNDADGVYNRQALRDNLQGEPMLLVRLVDREQGLIVAPGNPLGIHDIADLAREDVRFINRQRGSGTRVLLDYRLKQLGIRPQQLAGYEDEEYTHMNVAAAVLSGRAHTGLAVRAAACALGLDFVPVGVEEYDLVIPQRYAEDERILALLDVIRSEAFRKEVAALGGYGVEKTGQVIWEYDGR